MNRLSIAFHIGASRFLPAATVYGTAAFFLWQSRGPFQLRDGLVQAACRGLTGSAYHEGRVPC
jgi:hypothetical protein